MKTTKKILSLMLVVAMVVGLVQLASAETLSNYYDGDTVKYVEAVDVLTGINVLAGDKPNADGVMGIRPGDTITREEAAKVLTCLLLTYDLAEALPAADTGFPDVPASRWSSKYVAYCATQQIILGRADGKFYPTDNVTAAEFVIMIMRALKVGDPSRYVGSGWQLNAILDGMDMGFLDTGADYTAAALREEIFKYAFNALLFSPSGTSGSYQYIQTGWVDASVTNPVPKYEYVWVPSPGADSLAAIRYDLNKADKPMGLKSNASGLDDLGRPAKIWSYKGQMIAYMPSAPVATVFNKTVSENALFQVTNLGSDTTKAAAEIPAVVNSASGQAPATLTSLRNSNKSASATYTDVYGTNGNGIRTEIYATGPGTFKAVIIKASFAALKIETKAATATMGAYTQYTVNGISGKAYTSHVDARFELDTIVIDGDVADKDMVLYYVGDGDVLHVEAVDTITGVITSITSAGVITIGGSTTGFAWSLSPTSLIAGKDEGTYYVDSFGFILDSKALTVTGVPVVMILSADTYNVLEEGKIVEKYSVTFLDMDGQVSTVSAGDDYNHFTVTVVGPPVEGYYDWYGKVCVYSFDAFGNYLFAEVSDKTSTGEAAGATASVTISEIEGITKSTTALVNPDGYVTTASSATKFYIVGEKNAVTAVTGIANITTMGLPGGTALKATTAISYGATLNPIANVVIINEPITAPSLPFVFYLGSYEQLATGVTINAHINGIEDTITGVALNQVSGTAPSVLIPFALYANVSVSVTPPTVGEVSKTLVTSAHGDAISGNDLSFDTGIIFDGTTSVGMADADTPVYKITQTAKTPDTRKMDVLTASNLSVLDTVNGPFDLTGANDFAFVIKEFMSENIIAIYIFDMLP